MDSFPFLFPLIPVTLIAIIYIGFILFVVWAVLNIVRSLDRLADNQERSAASLQDIARSLRERNV